MYGPIAIDRAHRGHHLARRLYDAFRSTMAGRFDVGVLFIALANHRSLAVHTQGFGMERVRDFEFAGRGYALLAFAIGR